MARYPLPFPKKRGWVASSSGTGKVWCSYPYKLLFLSLLGKGMSEGDRGQISCSPSHKGKRVVVVFMTMYTHASFPIRKDW